MTISRHQRGRGYEPGRRDDGGSALVIALIFVAVFGLIVGVVLRFAGTGLLTTTSARQEAARTYSSDGAVDGAINTLSQNLSAPGSIDPSAPTSCFTLPASQLDYTNAINVNCTPRPGSGAPSGGGSLSNQPSYGLLQTASPTSTEGVVEAGANVAVQGDVDVANTLKVPVGSTLTSTTAVNAGTCTVAGTVTPTPTCGAAAVPDPVTDNVVTRADKTSWPGYPGGAATVATPYPQIVTLPAVPVCTTPLMTIQPGTYTDVVALNALLACPNTVFQFLPGVFYFDFTAAAAAAVMNLPNQAVPTSVVVGGVASGWTPGTTAPAGVPFPTAALPSNSPCDAASSGVEFVFGDSSRMKTSAGKVALCARFTGTNIQHVAVWAPTSATTVGGTATSSASTVIDTSQPVGAHKWTVSGGVLPSTVKVPNTTAPSTILTVGPYGTPLVPSDATVTSVTATVTETLSGTGISTIALHQNGSPATAFQNVVVCSPITNNCVNPITFVTSVSWNSGLTPAGVNGLSFDYQMQNPNSQPINETLTSIALTVTYTAPFHASTLTGPYPQASPITYAVVSAAGSGTILSIHGTVYAPSDAVDLGMIGMVYDAIDRGLVARDAQLSMTPAVGYAGPLISIPPLTQAPRDVVIEAYDVSTSTLMLRAEVSFTDPANATSNGREPAVLFWSHQ